MSDSLLMSLIIVTFAFVGVIVGVIVLLMRAPDIAARRPAVGIGTVRAVTDEITVEVETVCGRTFTGRLHGSPDDPVSPAIRPGAVLLVTFDPVARRDLSLADDMAAVRAAFDRMLVGKGLVTDAQLELIRHGTRGSGLVTASRPTGTEREDYHEMVLDLMVRRPDGGQFPAHETALIPASSLNRVCPGSVIDAYYRRGDESAVAVCVPPA